jgi:hypothetical protein
LRLDEQERTCANSNSKDADKYKQEAGSLSDPVVLVSRRECYPKGLAFTAGLFLVGIGLECWSTVPLYNRRRSGWGWMLASLSLGWGIGGFLSAYLDDKANGQHGYYCQTLQHDGQECISYDEEQRFDLKPRQEHFSETCQFAPPISLHWK